MSKIYIDIDKEKDGYKNGNFSEVTREKYLPIITDEELTAKQIIENGFDLTSENHLPFYNQLVFVAMWFRIKEGKGRTALRKTLEDFIKSKVSQNECFRCHDENGNFAYNVDRHYAVISRIVSGVMRRKSFTKVQPIIITKKELETINGCTKNWKLRKLMFTLLCIAKSNTGRYTDAFEQKKQPKQDRQNETYYDELGNRRTKNSLFISAKYLPYAVKLAGLRESVVNIKKMLCEVDGKIGKENQLIGYYWYESKDHKQDSEPYYILNYSFPEPNSEKAYEVENLETCIEQFKFLCTKCGQPTDPNEISDHSDGMCKKCYKEKRKNDVKNNVRRLREERKIKA